MSELAELIPLLVQKTANRKINWQTTESSVWCRFGNNIIMIDTGLDEDLDTYYTFELRDAQGKIVESIKVWHLPNNENMTAATLADLHKSARRISLKIDEVIDDIKRRLIDL